MFSQNLSSLKYFHKTLFCRSLGISLSTGRITDRGKVAYSWISPDPVKAGPILGVVVVVILVYVTKVNMLLTKLKLDILVDIDKLKYINENVTY